LRNDVAGAPGFEPGTYECLAATHGSKPAALPG